MDRVEKFVARITRYFPWNKLMTRNVERAKTFYADTIGWSFDGMPMPGSGGLLGRRDGRQIGGWHPQHQRPETAQVPESWMAYLAAMTSMRG